MKREIADELRRMAKHAGKEKEIEEFIAGVDDVNREIEGGNLVTRETSEVAEVIDTATTTEVAETVAEEVVASETQVSEVTEVVADAVVETPVAETPETVIEERANIATQVSSTGEAGSYSTPSDMPMEGGEEGEKELEITADMLETIVAAVADRVIEALGKDVNSLNERLMKVEQAVTMTQELSRQLRVIDNQMAETVKRLNIVESSEEEAESAAYDDMPIAHTSRIAARLPTRPSIARANGKVKQSFEDIANLTLRNAKGE